MRSRTTTLFMVIALVAAACAADSATTVMGGSPLPSGASPATTVPSVRADEAFPDTRCEANRAAGTITFLTGYDLAAAASILDVIVAAETGYYEELCLDVEIVASLASLNYEAVGAGDAQFASGGSFSGLVAHTIASGGGLVAAAVEGRTAIDTLIVRAGEATELADLRGATIGVKGALPPAVDVMLRRAGLAAGDDYDIVDVDGLDPVIHLTMDEIVGVPGWKSNEVGVLQRAGVGVAQFDPLDYGVPGSFGLIFTSSSFMDAHPTAAQDFVRATLRGLADAVADPDAATAVALDLIVERGNPRRLTAAGEAFRWNTEAALILDGTPEGLGLGVPDPEVLQAELDSYDELGYFSEPSPDAAEFIATPLVDGVYGDDDAVIWPA